MIIIYITSKIENTIRIIAIVFIFVFWLNADQYLTVKRNEVVKRAIQKIESDTDPFSIQSVFKIHLDVDVS